VFAIASFPSYSTCITPIDASTMSDNVKVAVTQHEPIWFDLAANVEKTCRLIEEAASNGAKLIAFPEVWMSGYPAWIWYAFTTP
jgi:predicted amidohydrolase